MLMCSPILDSFLHFGLEKRCPLLAKKFKELFFPKHLEVTDDDLAFVINYFTSKKRGTSTGDSEPIKKKLKPENSTNKTPQCETTTSVGNKTSSVPIASPKSSSESDNTCQDDDDTPVIVTPVKKPPAPVLDLSSDESDTSDSSDSSSGSDSSDEETQNSVTENSGQKTKNPMWQRKPESPTPPLPVPVPASSASPHRSARSKALNDHGNKALNGNDHGNKVINGKDHSNKAPHGNDHIHKALNGNKALIGNDHSSHHQSKDRINSPDPFSLRKVGEVKRSPIKQSRENERYKRQPDKSNEDKSKTGTTTFYGKTKYYHYSDDKPGEANSSSFFDRLMTPCSGSKVTKTASTKVAKTASEKVSKSSSSKRAKIDTPKPPKLCRFGTACAARKAGTCRDLHKQKSAHDDRGSSAYDDNRRICKSGEDCRRMLWCTYEHPL